MGFGGSTAAANAILKANRAMLGKRKKGKLSLAIDNPTQWVDPKTASPQLLREIRTRIQRQEKQRIRRTKIIVVSVLVLIIAGIILALNVL